jgi:hypothetical protein
MSATRGTLDSLLKDFYLGPVQEQLNNEMLVLQMYEKMSVDWSGRQTIIPIHVARSTSVGFAAEVDGAGGGGVLPAPIGQQTYNNLTVVARYLYGTFRISGPAVASAKNGGKGAFIGWMEAEMDKLVTDVKNTADYTMLNGGGVIGFITDSVADPTHAFTGDHAKVVAGTDVTLANCFSPGLDSADALINTTYLNDITAAVALHAVAPSNEGAGTITFVASQDTTAGGYGGPTRVAPVVVRAHTNLALYQGEPVGIMSNLFGNGGVAGTPDHFGIQVNGAARSGTLDTFARVTEANPGATGVHDLTVERIQNVLDEITVLSGEEPDVIICHPSLRANYVAVLSASLFATSRGGATKGDAGFLDLSYGNIPIKFSRHCPRGMMIFMNKKTWKLLQLQSGGFADLDGTTILRAAAQDAWEGFYRWYYNTVCVRPNANGLLVGIDVWS